MIQNFFGGFWVLLNLKKKHTCVGSTRWVSVSLSHPWKIVNNSSDKRIEELGRYKTKTMQKKEIETLFVVCRIRIPVSHQTGLNAPKFVEFDFKITNDFRLLLFPN